MSQVPDNLRPTVENLRALGNFQQTFRWGVVVSTKPAAFTDFNSQDINFRAESMSIPEKAGETTTITIRGNEVRQPGKHTYNSPITLVLVSTIDAVVQDFLYQWGNLCWETLAADSSGKTRMKHDLQANFDLYLLDNMDKATYKYKLIGCQLETPGSSDVDGSTSDPIKPSISIAYDYFTQTKLTAGTDKPNQSVST
jgi:hypothetical protein